MRIQAAIISCLNASDHLLNVLALKLFTHNAILSTKTRMTFLKCELHPIASSINSFSLCLESKIHLPGHPRPCAIEPITPPVLSPVSFSSLCTGLPSAPVVCWFHRGPCLEDSLSAPLHTHTDLANSYSSSSSLFRCHVLPKAFFPGPDQSGSSREPFSFAPCHFTS